MSLSSIALALFLTVFGVVNVFHLAFAYQAMTLGILALLAGVLMFCRK